MPYCNWNGFIHNQFILKGRASNTLAVSASVAKRNILPSSASRVILHIDRKCLWSMSEFLFEWKMFLRNTLLESALQSQLLHKNIACRYWYNDLHCIQNIWLLFRFLKLMNRIYTVVRQLLEIIWILLISCFFLFYAIDCPLDRCCVYVRSNIYTVRSLFFKKFKMYLTFLYAYCKPFLMRYFSSI